MRSQIRITGYVVENHIFMRTPNHFDMELRYFLQLSMIADNIQYEILSDENGVIKYCDKIPYINIQLFLSICKLYGYPMTVICQSQYIDKMYRDAYCICLSHLHFDVGRHCQRLALFKG